MPKLYRHIRACILIVAVSVVMVHISGCKKFLEVDPPSTSINEDNVYKRNETAIAVLTDMYAKLALGGDGGFAGRTGMSVFSGLSADELTLADAVTDERYIAYYRNQLNASSLKTYGSDFWQGSFEKIFICNAAIAGLEESTSLTATVKSQIIGEAKFMRALLYFYLVNYYGDVPLVLTTNPNENRLLPRTPTQEVYEQIVLDLKEAKTLLNKSFVDGTLLKATTEKVRPTHWAATALLARTYLYTAKYAEAEAEATSVIANASQFSLCPSISNVFLKNSTEAIWQLQPVVLNRNTADAMAFKLPANGPNKEENPVYLSAQIMNAFAPEDARRKAGGWVDSVIAGGTTYFFPSKYKANVTTGAATEYQMMFRLAEQYLIRAEARARQNNMDGAKADLNAIRTRAGLPLAIASDESSLVTAILKERQVELFTELGQRWFDLKRTGQVDNVMTNVTSLKSNGQPWQSYQQLYPIMFTDIERNPNLIQNTGY